MNNEMPIVIIGYNYCTTLGLIKALGETGYRIEVGKLIDKKPYFQTPEMRSKYVDKAIYLPKNSGEEMIKTIIQNFAVPNRKKVLIPSDDYCVALFDRNFNMLSQYFILPNANKEQGAVENLMKKNIQNELAKTCGIKVADSVKIAVTLNKTFSLPPTIPYPCLIKPNVSAGNPKSHIIKCENQDELIKSLEMIVHEQHKCTMLIEQFINIEKEYTIPGIAVGDNVIIPAVIEKIRIGDGAHKGVTITGRIHDSTEYGNIISRLEVLVKKMGFQGIFDVEFLYSDGEFYFNEINLRNGAAGYSLTKLGINIPAMYADYVTKSILPILSNKIDDNRTFVNEKAALENYYDGYSSFRTLIKAIGNADIRFVLYWDDINVSLSFCLLSILMITKRNLQRIFSKIRFN